MTNREAAVFTAILAAAILIAFLSINVLKASPLATLILLIAIVAILFVAPRIERFLQYERGVRFRFGKYLDTVGPGWVLIRPDLVVAARGEGGEAFTDREIRDQVMTLMFAGHDTSTSTLTFMLHELARHPEAVLRLCEEQDEVLGGAIPTFDQLERGMPYLDMVLDEVLRLYPPAWIGPRRAIRDFEFAGREVPRGAYVNYCSWASHRIPSIFPEPEAFIPERFTRERKAALPRGAYVPFGGGQRICIGKRFGQTEVKLVATMLLQQLRFDALPGRTMTVRQMPTLSPKGGLKMRVLSRA